MNLTPSHYIQLTVGLLMAFSAFVVAYSAPITPVVTTLCAIIPFQIVDSRYGSLNVGLVYLIGAAFFFRGQLRYVPCLGPFVLILLATLAAITQVPKSMLFVNILALVAFAANLILFWIVYNYVRYTQNPRMILVNVLLVMNAIAIVYCAIQLMVAPRALTLFGVNEFQMLAARWSSAGSRRLVGPFTAVGITAEFFVIQNLIFLYILINNPGKALRLTCFALIVLNFGFQVATANRGGFLSMIFGLALFMMLFRDRVSMLMLFKSGLVFGVGGAVILTLILLFTPFNQLFDRLLETEVSEEGIPDTRGVAWPAAIEGIKLKPMLGHGPFLVTEDSVGKTESRGAKVTDDVHRLRDYPHNLYLYIIYTIGFAGMFAFLILWLQLYFRMGRGAGLHTGDNFLDGLPKLGILVLSVMLFDQIKVSGMRFGLSDFQQYMFMLWSVFIASADICQEKAAARNQVHGDLEPA